MDAFQVLYVHVLDQSCPSARFTWHRDTEEDTRDMRVYYTLVLLLKQDGKTAGLHVAGAPQVAQYTRPGSAHIFDSALFHTTEVVPHAGGLKLGVFVGIKMYKK